MVLLWRGPQHAHDAFGARGGERDAERLHAAGGRHRHHGDPTQPILETAENHLGREGPAAAGQEAGPEAPAEEQCVAGEQPRAGTAVDRPLRPTLQWQDCHVRRFLLGHGEASVRDD